MSGPLRILQVSRVFWPNIGGIEQHVAWLSQHLRRRGHVCDVVTLNRSFVDLSPYPPYDNRGGVNVYRVPFLGSTRYPIAPRVLRFVQDYDVVHVHAVDFLADWLVATRPLHGKPVVLSTHGGFFHTAAYRAIKTLWFQTATRVLVNQVDALIYTSEADAALFGRITRRGELVRQAVDTGPYLALAHRPEAGRFVTVGRVDVHKGISALLKVLAALKRSDPRPFHLDVVGPEVVEGLGERLRAEAAALGLGDSVTFHGKVSTEALHAMVSRAELGLFPAEYESFGISVVEAMAAGVVPVLNDIPAFRAFIQGDSNGFVVDYRDAPAAARTIAAARDLGARHQGVSEAARATARKYDWAEVVVEVEGTYERVIRARGADVPRSR